MIRSIFVLVVFKELCETFNFFEVNIETFPCNFKMYIKVFLFCLFLCCFYVAGEEHLNVTSDDRRSSPTNETTDIPQTKDFDRNFYLERSKNQTKAIENILKKYLKMGVKNILPTLMKDSSTISISSKCTNALMKYLSGLTTVKVWAIRMLDATAKPPSGILEGTLSDFGAFDSCLEIEVPKRNGDLEFRGQYCAAEMWPRLPPIPNNFSIAKQTYAEPMDSIGVELMTAGTALHYIKPRFGICIPSACSLQDVQLMAERAGKDIPLDVKIPQCYVKEGIQFEAIHIVVIFILTLLVLACIAGTAIEYRSVGEQQERPSTLKTVLRCFSLMTNYNRLMSVSGGPGELKALNGLRTLTMAWVMLGHNYGWTDFDLLRRPKQVIVWFNGIDFETATNAWLSVETFFFLSGFFTSYRVLMIMAKTKGRLSVPLYIIRRYIRLTPSLLLVMGLAFFMPLVSSGPFWYERIDQEIRSCRKNWWMSILYISNWFGMRNICVHTTWYLSADFQLYVFTIGILFALYRSPKLGFALISSVVIACNVAIGVVTNLRNLPPTILIASGHAAKIEETVSSIYMQTYTHAGSYYVGIVAGYLILKYKDIKITKTWNCIGWCCSTFLCMTSLYGLHRWSIGEAHGPILTSLFAAVHRTLFTAGVAWVVFACATGYGGWVNKLLSSPLWVPFGRLSFIIYLLHGLVIWVRLGTARERAFYSHYNMLYDYIGNTVTTIVLSIPVYLLLEAPLSNLEGFCFSRARRPAGEATDAKKNGHLSGNVVHFQKNFIAAKGENSVNTSVELTAVKSLDLVQNTAVLVDANNGKLS